MCDFSSIKGFLVVADLVPMKYSVIVASVFGDGKAGALYISSNKLTHTGNCIVKNMNTIHVYMLTWSLMLLEYV